MAKMRVVHRGFDGLALSIEARVPVDLAEEVEVAKRSAEAERCEVLFSRGGAEFHLKEYGGKGYAYLLHDGPLGARWSLKKPNLKDPWGVHVQVGSTFLATQGLGAARAYIADTMAALGMRFVARQVSLARVDFCVDIHGPDFDLCPQNLVFHSHANRADHEASKAERRSNGGSGRYTSSTIGKMPGRQIIIYDKRAEILSAGGGKKDLWWNIWDRNLTREGLPPLDRHDPQKSRVWRIEARAGKRLLKDRWQVRTWADFDAKFGDILAEAFDRIRYTQPDPCDSNRSRWQDDPIWMLARTAIDDDLKELRSYVEPPKVREVYREAHARLMEKQVLGSAISLAALLGTTADALPEALRAIGEGMRDKVQSERRQAVEKLASAAGRYRFLG